MYLFSKRLTVKYFLFLVHRIALFFFPFLFFSIEKEFFFCLLIPFFLDKDRRMDALKGIFTGQQVGPSALDMAKTELVVVQDLYSRFVSFVLFFLTFFCLL